MGKPIDMNDRIENLFPMKDKTELAKLQKAYQELQQYRKSSPIERNYKAELAEALEEKYAGINLDVLTNFRPIKSR